MSNYPFTCSGIKSSFLQTIKAPFSQLANFYPAFQLCNRKQYEVRGQQIAELFYQAICQGPGLYCLLRKVTTFLVRADNLQFTQMARTPLSLPSVHHHLKRHTDIYEHIKSHMIYLSNQIGSIITSTQFVATDLPLKVFRIYVFSNRTAKAGQVKKKRKKRKLPKYIQVTHGSDMY